MATLASLGRPSSSLPFGLDHLHHELMGLPPPGIFAGDYGFAYAPYALFTPPPLFCAMGKKTTLCT